MFLIKNFGSEKILCLLIFYNPIKYFIFSWEDGKGLFSPQSIVVLKRLEDYIKNSKNSSFIYCLIWKTYIYKILFMVAYFFISPNENN